MIKKILLFTILFIPLTPAAQTLPDIMLGGVLKSDRWVIKKNSKQEEFFGNVSYDTPTLKLRSDYAASDRRTNFFKLDKNAYIMHITPEGETYELNAETVTLNTNLGVGTVKGGARPLRVLYDLPGQYTLTAESDKADFNTNKEAALLQGGVKLDYKVAEDFVLAYADTVAVDRKNSTLRLTGDALVQSAEYTALANSIFIDNKAGTAVFKGNYPVFTADKETALIAVQAEHTVYNIPERKISAQGRIRGWIQPLKE